MRNILISIGAVLFIVIGIVTYAILTKDSDNINEVMPEAASLEESNQTNQTGIEAVEVSYSNIEILERVYSKEEVMATEERLTYLFGQYLPQMVNMNLPSDRVFSQNSEEIKTQTGLVSYDQFDEFYSKILRIPEYDKCMIKIDVASLVVEDNSSSYDLYVIYDDAYEVIYYITSVNGAMEFSIN